MVISALTSELRVFMTTIWLSVFSSRWRPEKEPGARLLVLAMKGPSARLCSYIGCDVIRSHEEYERAAKPSVSSEKISLSKVELGGHSDDTWHVLMDSL